MLSRMLTEAGAMVLHKPMPMSTHWQPGMAGNPESWDGVWTDFSLIEWEAAVVIQRDFNCTVKAQVAAGHVKNEKRAIERTRQALANIYGQLSVINRPFFTVSYESLARPEALVNLCGRIKLDSSKIKTTWHDANAKYYGGKAWSDHDPLWKRPSAGAPPLVPSIVATKSSR